MQIGSVKPGDIVFVEKKQGWRFLAYVEDRVQGKQELRIKPVQGAGPTYRTCTSREVKRHYKLAGAADKSA